MNKIPENDRKAKGPMVVGPKSSANLPKSPETTPNETKTAEKKGNQRIIMRNGPLIMRNGLQKSSIASGSHPLNPKPYRPPLALKPSTFNPKFKP